MPSPAADSRAQIDRLQREIKRLREALDERCPDLRTLLRRRGFAIYKQETSEDLLLPARRHIGAFYALLHKYSFRLFLRDVIKHQEGFCIDEVARYATPRVTREYVRTLTGMGLLRERDGAHALARRPVRSFGPTLEWYVAEVLKREFGCEAAWGVKFRRPAVGGDYDVIARMDSALLYAEVKSSPPKQIYDSEVDAFLDRVEDIAPEIAIFLMDTELRMKDKIVPMFEEALTRRLHAPPGVERMERELFRAGDRMFIINAKEEVLQNIRTVLSWYYRSAKAVFGGRAGGEATGRAAGATRAPGRARRPL